MGLYDKQYSELNKVIKTNCHKDQRAWIERKVSEEKAAAHQCKLRTLYKIMIGKMGSHNNAGVPIRKKDSKTPLTEKKQNERWVEHFKGDPQSTRSSFHI